MPVMSNDTSDNLGAAIPLESAEEERAVVEQDLRSLENKISSAENELAALKTRHKLLNDILKAETDCRQALEAQCEQFVKATEELSSTTTDLSTKLCQEKSSRLEKLPSFQQYTSGIYNGLEKNVWTPEALESLAATLRMQLRDLEQRSAYLDSRLERKRAELDQLQEQSTNNCSAEDATFGPEEQQAILLVLLHVKVVNTHTNFTKQHRLKSHF
ncbi:uncharacterized protein LOC119435122 [Dermacentor silvarum]|uniref:uncharacterized protein LOC119435122 n=1 Tax=Dermacentor silvarum TaxID=543639 RepID=UPI001898987A|nr:uncharacterized protein LOC119435122 [Dermacentor silvarum]